MLTGILFGLVPAISASRKSLAAALNESSNRAGVGFRSGKVRSLLVVSEMALALVLVIGAALLIRTFMNLQSVDPGFDTHNVLTMAMSIGGDRFLRPAASRKSVRDGTERINAVPGVTASAAACCLPLQGGFGLPFNIVGRANGNNPNTGGAGYFPVSWSYFDVFKVPLVRGRNFTEQDNGSAPGVVIINEAMAQQFWPKGDPLSDRIVIGAGMGPVFVEPPRQVIGVVGDTRNGGLESGSRSHDVYSDGADAGQSHGAQLAHRALVVDCAHAGRAPHVRPPSPTRSVKRRAACLWRTSAAWTRSSSWTTSRERFNMLLLTIFGTSALLMAAIGIYGLMAYSVQQRTQELGVSMALGAHASNIRNMVIRQGMLLAAIGVVIGIGGALWLAHFLTSFLFGVKTWDPAAFMVTPILLSVMALLAVWIPARRATRVSPITALRFE